MHGPGARPRDRGQGCPSLAVRSGPRQPVQVDDPGVGDRSDPAVADRQRGCGLREATPRAVSSLPVAVSSASPLVWYSTPWPRRQEWGTGC